MKSVAIVGIGVGANTITHEAMETICNAEVLAGAPRMLEIASAIVVNMPKRQYSCYLPEDISAIIAKENAERFVVLVSGDVGFFSAATKLSETLDKYNCHLIPGVSTVNAFFAKLKIPWQEAAFISAHGRIVNIASYVRRNRLTFCLTGNNTADIAMQMKSAGLGHITTYFGENLGTEQEHIFETTAGDLLQAPLTVLLFKNDIYDDRTPTGLPDDNFVRIEGVPMTKSEVRAIAMSKLNISPHFVCYDIGAGTGSVTVEMALSAHRGHVYAIERRKDAIPLISRNLAAFNIDNVTTVCGEAPSALNSLPVPDAVFIGGSSGEIAKIIQTVLEKNLNIKIVITAVTIETVSLAIKAFESAGMKPDITQISIARGKRTGKLHLMEAQNPITIISSK